MMPGKCIPGPRAEGVQGGRERSTQSCVSGGESAGREGGEGGVGVQTARARLSNGREAAQCTVVPWIEGVETW